MRIFTAAVLCPIFWLLLAPTAGARDWLIDPAHSAAHFSITHMTIAEVRGHFADLTGTATLDARDDQLLALRIRIGVASVATGVSKRDDHLRSADFFAAPQYPVMTFVAKEIAPAPDGPARITGALTIKGITKQVTFDLHGPTDAITDPWGNLRKGAKISTTINRLDYGITYSNLLENGGLTIGNLVRIEADLEFLILKPAN
jgi:polyisoprenoid-binding protein YceI